MEQQCQHKQITQHELNTKQNTNNARSEALVTAGITEQKALESTYIINNAAVIACLQCQYEANADTQTKARIAMNGKQMNGRHAMTQIKKR